jgi:transcription elongation factor Elf1
MSTHPRSNDDSAPPKAVLFCPDCGHESAATGDWVVDEREGRCVYRCPDCGAEIATRGNSRRLCCA